MSALLGFLTFPGDYRRRHGQNEVIIACAEIVNLESGDRVRSAPHDDADLPASRCLPRCIGDDARALFRGWCVKVDACAAAFAPSDNFEIRNRNPYGLIERSLRRALQGRSDDLSFALIDAAAL